MRYTTKLYTTNSASILIPEFYAETGGKREEESVRRMNGFYNELKSSVIGYTESSTFPEGGKYYAKAQITSNDERLEVRVSLRLRSRGRTVSARTLTHTWCDGVVIEKKLDV